MIRADRADSIRSFIRIVKTNSLNDRRAILEIVRTELDLSEEVAAIQPLAAQTGKVLKFSEAAERFGMGVRWLQKQIQRGKIAAVKSGARAIGVTEAEVNRFIQANQTPINTPEAKPQEAMHEAEA